MATKKKKKSLTGSILSHWTVLFTQDQGRGVPVWPPSAGQVSAETMSVPLRGRRQVHLQQGELLGPVSTQATQGRPKEGQRVWHLTPRKPAAHLFLPLATDVCAKKDRCCSAREYPKTAASAFIFLLHQAVKPLLSNILLIFFYYWTERSCEIKLMVIGLVGCGRGSGGWIQQLICNAVAGDNAILSNISVRQQTAALKQSTSFLASFTHNVFSTKVGSDKYLREQCADCFFFFKVT